jgi:hypothetical protein
MVDVKKVTGATQINASDNDAWVVLFAIECRGLEPVEWMPRKDFTVTSSGGVKFEEVEIEDGLWADYDGENDMPVSIQNLTWEFFTC